VTANVALVQTQATYSAVNLIAGAGIMGNVGGVALAANVALANAITAYVSVPVVAQFMSIVAAANGAIDYTVVNSVFPALTNSVPAAEAAGNIDSSVQTAAIQFQSNRIIGQGLGQFDQVLSAALGLVGSSNQMINSVAAANSAAANIGFVSADNITTGGLSTVTEAFAAFGADLQRTGTLINLNNLDGLGSPQALLQQVLAAGTLPAGVNAALLDAGIAPERIAQINASGLTDTEQRQAYLAMTQITGPALQQTLALLNVTTPNVLTMADLLNPVVIFPTSFNTLTAPTSEGLRGIYLDSTGTVNSALETTLPQSVLRPLLGNPLQNIVPRGT
jgi:hypothetical protein